MIDCGAINKFINTYNLPTLPLTKACTLQLTNSSYTTQKITYIV